MERWSGILKIPLHPNSRSLYRIAASVCLSSTLEGLSVPSANVIFFNGDRIQETRNPVIERLSDLLNIADILVSKFGASVNAWVIEASVFNGPFAVYSDLIPSVNQWGEPRFYSAEGSPASTSTVSLLQNFLGEAKNTISRGRAKGLFGKNVGPPSYELPKTCILGFSKGGTVLNQLVTELGFLEVPSHQKEQSSSGDFPEAEDKIQIIPCTKEGLLNSITEIHYVDAGLNSAGAYITESNVIERISKRLAEGAPEIRFVLHGTPRQWCDSRRALIRNEKDRLLCLLESAAQKSGRRLQVFAKGVDRDLVVLMSARASRLENQVAIDAAIVSMLADPKEIATVIVANAN